MCRCAESHPADKVSYMWDTTVGGSVRYKQRTFNVIGNDIIVNLEKITLGSVSVKLMTPTKSTAYDSPVRKFVKRNTPTKSVHCKMFFETDNSAGTGSIIDQSIIMEAEEDYTMVDLSEQLDCTILYSESGSDDDDLYEVESLGDVLKMFLQTMKL